MHVPLPRGPISEAVLPSLLDGAVPSADQVRRLVADRLGPHDGAALEPTPGAEDLHLTLWSLYELHYRGFDDARPDLEWDPAVLAVRAELERPFEAALRHRARGPVTDALGVSDDVVDQIEHLTTTVAGSDLTRYLQREASRDQFLEVMRHRSVYTLKESDPTSWVLPRVDGRTKAALAELQYDEYGGGRPDRLHAALFARGLEALGLDATYGAHVDVTPGPVLAVNNAMSLFGLHRRLRGAALGHLAAFESTSTLPCRKIASGIRRLDLPDEIWEYFDEHVEADAVHEQVALRDICGSFVETHPDEAEDLLLGVVACLQLEEIAGTATLDGWRAASGDRLAAEHPVSA
jgi:hypothetical protein